MKTFLILTVLLVSAPITFLRADDKPLSAPPPVKDPKASKQHCYGTGIFEMIVDKPSGKVEAVFVRGTTKNVLLDADVINTFLQWRFRPNTKSFVKIAVAFTPDNDTAFYPAGNIHATTGGIPRPFKEPVAPARLWQWYPELYGTAGHR